VKFFEVTKPGIIFGNVVTVSGGFFLGSHTHFNFWLFLSTLLAMSLVVACGCVLNNIIDRDIDHLMDRTKNRVIVKGLISLPIAFFYALILGALGFVIFYFGTNLLALSVAAIGLFFYVIVYSLFWKRRSTLGTTIGGIAGAVPPVVGYCAATHQFNAAAVILFLILFFWQMPHFYAISIYRLKDFAAAGIPILPIKKSIPYTKVCILLYIIAFTIVAVMPTLFGYIGWIYFSVALALGLIWLALGIKGFRTQDNRRWARKMFLFSILNITLLSLVMIVKM
jgi:protoheme IX farnesyltransferase